MADSNLVFILNSFLWISFLALPPAASATDQFLYGSRFEVPVNASFDYIIVGGGTAGLTIAARLVQNFTVAVIEAGSFYEIGNGNLSQIPLYDAYFVGKDPDDYNPLVDWGFVTTPQKGSLNKSSLYARGKTLGGCSARNYMAFHRGTKQAYEKWAQQVGDQGYTFENWLPFFQKVYITRRQMPQNVQEMQLLILIR